MDDFANALKVSPKFVYTVFALILIAIVYQVNPKAGTLLGIIAIIAILTQ